MLLQNKLPNPLYLQSCLHINREAAVWDNLGYAEHHLGNLTEAAAYYQRSLALFRETGNRLHQAVILDHLGDNSRAAGDLVELEL